jgi:Ca2+-binding RTX toxin-like protein
MSKKAFKKNSQRNFNIEPLEPRLLMAAHSDILIGAIDAIESFDSVTANPAADEVDGLKQQIVGDFNDYKVDVIAAINSIDWSTFIQAEGQSLQDAVGEFVSNKIQSSEINVGYTSGILEFSSTKSMDLSSIPGMAISNQVSADASVKLDLAADSNGDLTASLNNASLNIGNLGAAATFMGISIQEKDISDDNDLEVSVDKTNGNKVDVDLEFEITNLPSSLFSVDSSSHLKVSSIQNPNVTFPDVSFNSSVFDLDSVIQKINTVKLPGNLSLSNLDSLKGNIAKACAMYHLAASTDPAVAVDADLFSNMVNKFIGVSSGITLNGTKLEFKLPQSMSSDLDMGLFKVSNVAGDLVLTMDLSNKDNPSVESVKLNVCATSSMAVNTGLFYVDLENANFNAFVEIVADGSDYKIGPSSNISLGFDKVTLKSGNSASAVGIFELDNVASGSAESFKYDITTGEWEYPDALKDFTNITGSNLVNRLEMAIQTLLFQLRNQITKGTSAEALGSIAKDSLGSIIDYAEKLETFETELLDKNETFYKGAFENLDEFIEKLNNNWTSIFGGTAASNLITMTLYDKNDVEVSGSNIASGSIKQIRRINFLFNMDMKFAGNIDLSLGAMLGKGSFANVKTSGDADFEAAVQLVFDMDVQFKRETLENSDAIFADAFSGVTTAVNENYYTVKIAKDTYDASTAFEFKDASDKTLSYDFIDNRLYIYGDSGFTVNSSKVSSVEKSLYDLNLSGNDVQATSLVKVNSATNKINLEFKDDAGTMHSEEIVLKDICDLSVSGVTCQDLQHALELFLKKTTFQNKNNGTSKESSYGIYVVYVRDSSTAGEYEIRFGCDAKKMKNTSSYSLESCSVDGCTCMVQDMRVSGTFDAEKDVDKITIDSLEIDVSECNTVASVYQKVKSSITGTDISLSFDGTNLVFTSANTLSIKKDSTAVSSDSEDFVIAPKNGSSIRVDLGNISSSTTLLEVVQKIETYLVGTTITIDYAGKDHIEFKSSGEFSIESLHTNKILKALGFGDKNKSVYYEERGVGEYRIFGAPIGEMDLTELIKIGDEWSVNAGIKASLTNINASATLGFLGVGITASGELGYTLGFDSTDPQKTTEGLGTFTNKLNVDVNASIGGVDKKILNATNCALTDGSVIKFDNLVNTFKTSISLDPFLSDISNFSIETVYGMVTDFAEKIVDATNGINFEIPLINKKVSDLVNVADSVLSVVDTLRAENVSDIQSFAIYFSKYLEDAGLTVSSDVLTSSPKIVDLKWDNVNKALEFDLNLMKIFGDDDGFDLNFGKSGNGINGHANLGLTGGLWFKMSALVSANNGFVLKDSGIKFGANIGISGSKLSFDLGFNAGVTNMDLLKNLIKVGSDGDDSFIHMKASFEGEIGSDGSQVTAVTFDKDDYSVFATILGRLPISIKGYTLGNIYLGKWNSASNTVVGGNIDSYAGAKLMSDVFGSLDVKNMGFSMLMLEDDKSSLTDGTLVTDFSEVYAKIQSLGSGDIDFFDKIKLAVAGLDELFTRIESGLNGKLMSQLKDMPIMGDALSNGVDFLSAIRDRVLEPFSDFVYESTGFNAKMIAEKLGELFTSKLTSVTGISQYDTTDAWSLADGIAYRSGAEYAEWFLELSDVYQIGTDLGFDLGMPGLEIAGDGGVSLEIGWNLQFGFEISERDGFYFFFNEGDENEFTAGAKVHFDKGSKINGSISKLAMQLEMDDDDLAEFSFNVDLGRRQVNHISNVISSITPNVVARTNISAGITVGFGKIEDSSSSSKYPKFNGNFDFMWDVSNGVTLLGFSSMTIDVGTFVSKVLGPVVNRAKEVIEPMKELIDFLTTPFPVLDDLGVELTPLKLAKMYSKNPDFDDSFIFEVKEIVNIADKISAFGKASKDGDVYIELPNYWLIGGIDSSGSSAANNFIQGKAKSTTLDNSKYMDTTAKPTLADPDSKVSNNGLSDIVDPASADSHWKFFWQDMQGAYRLLLGEDIDLVHYTMSPLNFEFSWDTFFPVYGPLGVRLDIAFGANINLGFGYDTYGIRQYIGSGWKDYGALVNGFYVDDLHDGKDSSELEFYGGVKASAEFNGGIIKGGVGGGVTITTGLDMFDPNEDGKLRLKEFKQTAEDSGVMGMFDLKGKISAELFAYVEFLFYTEEWDITGEITLFDFTANVNRNLDPVMAHEDEDEGNVIANVGDNSQERVYKGGANNSLDDGQETVEFELDGDQVIWEGDEKHNATVDTSKGGRLIIKSGADVDKIILTGEANFDIEIHGGDGDDVIDLSGLTLNSDHVAYIWGDAGSDTILGAIGKNVIFGDSTMPRNKDDKKYVVNVDPGASGGDYIYGNIGDDIIFGGAGDDKIYGNGGNDILVGDGGEYDVTNNAVSRTAMSDFGGADIIVGGEGDDKIYGGSGDDKIDGSAGDDKIFGETGNDWILGGSDNDKIEGGAGMDIIFGDRFSGSSFDLKTPFGNLDGYSQEFIDAHSENNAIKVVQASDFIFSLPDGKGVTVPEFATDSLTTYGTDEINGGDGNDLILGDGGGSAGGNDIIHGGIGNDVIDGDGGNDTICGGIDNDIIYGGDGDDIIDGGAGDDKLYGDAGVTAITLGTTKFTPDETNLDFASNLGLNKNIYIDSISSPTEKGDDRIITGPGMDYVDGQAGNDKVTVNLMGDSSVNYANVVDTGADTDVNTLVVEGTENDDNLLVRRSKEENSLGFVALLPTGGVNQNSSNANTNIERVNFTEAISVVNLNANGGDDLVSLDGSAKSMNIDGGAGKDTFQIGQLYKSERETTNSAQVLANDAYNTVKTNEEEYLGEGVTKDTVVNIEGGSDVDTFIVNHNEGRLNLKGGKGDDNFAIFSYQDENDKPITNGPMSVDGGKGNDSLLVRGTNGDDQFVVSKEGMLSSVVSIKVAGVETTTYDAAAGDDLFNVVSSNAGESQTINGGKGNDTVSVGGIDKAMVLRNADTDGQHCTIKNSIVTEGYDDRDTNFDDVSSAVAEFAIMDTTNSPVVYLKDGVTGRVIEQIDAQEGTPKVVKVCYAGNAKIGSITVSIAAPQLSNMGLMSGDRGIMVSTDGTTWKDTATLVLDSSTKEASLYVKAFGDKLAEEPSIQSLSLTSTWTNLEFSGLLPKMKKMELQKSTTVLSVNVSDAATSTAISKAMTFAEEVTIVSGAMNLNEVFTKSKSKASFEFDVYIKGVDGYLVSGTDYRIADDSITFLGSTNVGKEAVIIYRSNSMYVASSKCYIADEEATVTSVIYNKVEVPEKSVASGDIYYVQNGNTIVFYNGSNNRLMTVHGEITVTATMPTYGTPVNTGVAPTPSQDTGAAAYKILVEQNETRIAEGTDSDAYSNTTYVVKLSAAPTVNSAVYVCISPTKLIDKISSTTPEHQLEISCADTASVVSTEADGSLIVKFTQANWQSGLTINVHAKADGFDEDYGIVNVDKSEKLIDEVDGALYAFGEGTSAENVDADTQMLSYQHHLTVGEELKEASVYNEKNEYDSNLLVSVDSLMEASLSIAMPAGATVSAYEGKTVRFVSTNANGVACGTDDNGKTIYKNQSDWFRIDKCEIKGDKLVFTLNSAVDYFTKDNSSLLFSGNKDYLFVNEAESVDRIFVNNQAASRDANSTFEAFATKLAEMNFDPTKTYTGEEVAQIAAELGLVGMDAENVLSFFKNVSETEGSMNKDPNALRFTHTEIGKRGISVSDFEFGEYNLGTGSDTVDISKTLHREDGFQTFTVVNTGDINSAKSNTVGEVIGTATFSASSVSAAGLFHYDIAVDTGVTFEKTAEDTRIYYVDAEIVKTENGETEVVGTQRREIVGVFDCISGFNVKDDFILRDGESIAGFTFIQAKFDDIINVNSYKEDVASTVIAESVVVDLDEEETDESPATEAEESDTEETVVMDGFAYNYTIKDEYAATIEASVTAATEAGKSIYVDAKLSDGTTQRRLVVAGSLTSSSFRTDRAFTLPSDDSIYIKSFSFGYGYVGDGLLVVNAESGNDQIFGVNPNVTRNDMVLFGGKGADYINVSQGGIAFGDMGVVEYASLTKADEFTTRLGYELIDDEPETIHTTIAKDASGKLDKQTDGIRRNATNVRSVADDIGDIDMITLGGTDSNVIGGAKGDVLSVSGNMNVLLGDSGSVQYDAGNLENAVYGDSVGKGLHIVETTSDDIGGVDNISISGGKNIAMGGFAGDDIRITGADNIAAGDGGKLEVFEKRQVLETTSDELGGEDFITTGDGANVVLGGTTHDVIHTGAGNDTIVGDGGKVVMDLNRNALLVTNEGNDIPVLEGEGENAALKSSAGKDRIDAGDGDNVVMGGLDNDTIDTGTGKDVVFGDNAYATFRGNASEAQNQLDELQNIPTIYDESTLSFNFQGPAQTGVAANEQAGAVADYTFSQMDETTGEFVDVTEHADYRVGNWNNIKNPSGIEAGTYGNEDDEIVLFDNGSRASAVSVTYGATEAHRIDTTTGQQIRLHGYDQSNMVHGSDPGDVNLMKSGLDTSRNNDQTKLLVQVDGLSQYFTDYDVVVYLDMVRENSWSPDSVRMVTLYRDYVDKNGVSHSDVAGCYFVNDPESNTFNGNWIVATATTAEQARNARDIAGNPVYANCVIFKGISGDRFHVEITDGDPSNGQNGKDRAGIAGIQVRGRHHKQDVAASTDIAYGGNDTVRTSGGDDIVVGGTGNDQINTYGDEHYGINDNDVVFGDNAKMLFTDRDDAATTASTITTAESVISTDMSATYDDTILTGDGDDMVVGGLGVDKIDASATPTADGTLDGVDVVSLNFVDISTPESLLMRQGESAGVVVDSNWHNVYQTGSQQREFGQDPTDVHFRYHINGNNDAPTEKVNASMDADTGNNKMFKTYVCGQAHDTLTLELSNIPASESDPRDVYVYISGIDNERDGYDYIFKITGSNGQTYFLNDWMGDCFDGEYKQVTCTSYQKGALASGVTPNVTMIGNYVVFRNVKASSLTVSISRYDSTMGDAKWNNIPVFSGVQIVKSSLPTEAIEVGGDHDKDLVFGDEARLLFDLDIPFAGDENVADYRNRVITSESVAMTDGNVAKGAGDTIVTGKDRDVVVGGEGIDEVYSGAGDDVVIGDRASLKVEHNNPVGVFSQNVEIVLEDNDYTKAQRRRFVDGDTGMSVNEMQDQVRQGRIEGIALETAGDTGDHVYDESSKNLVFNGNLTATGFEVPDIEFAGSEMTPDDGNNQTEPDDNNTQPLDGETGNGETGNGQGGETGDGETGNGQGSETGDGETGNGQGDEPGITTIESYDMQTPLFLTAGETVKVVFHEFYRDTNYVPNLKLIFIGSQGRFPAIDVDLETATGPLHLDIPSTWWYSVDVPDQPNGENGCFEIYFRAEEDTVVVVSIAQ